ncbi:MAG: acylphosphatase [Candidatus Sumerlaeia bacterium]|nr:acylphosphatase [Candidatus Sumerlaeia bacterium]
MAYLKAIVHGMVQGVGYRYVTRNTAQRLGVKGFVRNLDDGTVEVQAVGDLAVLQRLVEALERGPEFVDFRIVF